MKTFKEYLTESRELSKCVNNIKFIESDLRLLMKKSLISRDIKFNIEYVLSDPKVLESELKSIEGYYKDVFKIITKKYKKLFYFDKEDFITRMFDYYEEPPDWPVIIYVSPDKHTENTIGLIVYKNGKIDIFEGNENIDSPFINELLGKGDIEVRIYASHDENVVENIIKTKKLPVNLYVTPNKSYAEKYWGENRVMFTGMIKLKFINQESDVDWKVTDKATIDKIKII